jgi:hypothetical protein
MTDREILIKLHSAVLKNTGRPLPEELEKIKVDKKILTSPKFEGDSKTGTILFCGVAKLNGIDDDSIMDFLCIEGKPELVNKTNEFSELFANNKEFAVKVNLIQNYLKIQ